MAKEKRKKNLEVMLSYVSFSHPYTKFDALLFNEVRNHIMP